MPSRAFSVKTCQMDLPAAPSPPLPRPSDLARARGHVRVSLKTQAQGTALDRLFQDGSGRLRLLRHGPRGVAELALINTAGGLTGGDQWQVEMALAAGASASLTTPACEKLYRSLGEPARVTTQITLAEDARLDWLPQEAILHEGAALARTLRVEMAASADLLLLEGMILGRLAMGEQTSRVHLRDAIDIFRDGRRVLAERIALADVAAARASPARLAGADAYASVIHVAPDAPTRLEAVRETLTGLPIKAAASAWNGLLVVRLLGYGSEPLRPALVRLLQVLRPGGLPRLWQW